MDKMLDRIYFYIKNYKLQKIYDAGEYLDNKIEEIKKEVFKAMYEFGQKVRAEMNGALPTPPSPKK